MRIVFKGARYSVAIVLLLFVSVQAIAGPQIDVVVGPKPPELERFAAAELAGQFKQLFDADVKISDKVPAHSPHLILLGSMVTNPAIAGLGVQLPKLSDQGQIIRYAAS